MPLKMSSANWQPFYLDRYVLWMHTTYIYHHHNTGTPSASITVYTVLYTDGGSDIYLGYFLIQAQNRAWSINEPYIVVKDANGIQL